MNINRILGLLVMAWFAVNSFAQMTFTFANNVTPTVQTLSDGTILVCLPEGREQQEASTCSRPMTQWKARVPSS